MSANVSELPTVVGVELGEKVEILHSPLYNSRLCT